MKTIGLIGGMSWESTLEYYRILNQTVKERLGGLHSAKCILYSVEFAEIEVLQREGRWQEAAQCMLEAGRALEAAGADFIVLCTNTMHKLVPEIEAGINIPLLHIADATAEAVKAAGITRVGLLGTRFTMEQDFYKERLSGKHELEVLIPDAADREIVHNVIYNELCLGVVKQESRDQFSRIIDRLAAAGAQGVILGCTEIESLVRPQDSVLPVFATTKIHAEAAVEYALV
ncbi:MAG TPA: aspartate/glutamate racemase family protein [Anaerolineaceae bacterium]|nr:aspartate/glutamate racemase family protein [Anaerolineaceae bacterium]